MLAISMDLRMRFAKKGLQRCWGESARKAIPKLQQEHSLALTTVSDFPMN